MMFALAYVSTAKDPFDQLSLRELCLRSAEKNRGLDVTGYLNYNQGVFFQYLEGEKEVLSGLMATISRDRRHTIENEVPLGEQDERLFPNWRMRYLSPGEMRSIYLEDVLEKVLLTMKSNLYSQDMIINTVLRLVKKLSTWRTVPPLSLSSK